MVDTIKQQGIGLIESTQSAIDAFETLTTDEKLGLLWVVYENMGDAVTPAAPGAANEQFIQTLLGEVKALSHEQQLQFMRDLINRTPTDLTRQYDAFTTDNKLAFWFELAQEMRAGTVVPMPEGYQLPQDAAKVFSAIALMDFQEQITVLRHAVIGMGI